MENVSADISVSSDCQNSPEIQAVQECISKIKVLCLHGFESNKNVVEHQIGYYKHYFRDYVDFQIINGIRTLEKVYDQKLRDKFDPPFYCWFDKNLESGECTGISESLRYIVQYMNEHGPFDGVFGFSQGTMMSRIILKLNEFECYQPELNGEANPNEITLIHGVPKFGILFSPVFSPTSKYHCTISQKGSILYIPESEEDMLKLRTGFQQPIFYSYGKLESNSDYITKSVIEEGDYTLLIHKYGHNIPKFIHNDMSVFGKFIKKVYLQCTGNAT